MNNSRKYRFAQVNSSKIFSDQRYQRPVDPVRVKAIASEFDPDFVDPVKLSKRPDGKYYIFDGQHTLEVLKLMNGNRDLNVDAKIYTGLTFEDEARMFAKQDKLRKNVAPHERMKALYWAKDETVLALKTAVEGVGLTFDFTKEMAPRKITSYDAAMKLFRRAGTEMFEEILSLIVEAWPGDGQAFRQEIMNAVFVFMLHYGGDYDRAMAVKQFSKREPMEIIKVGKNCSLSRRSAVRYPYSLVLAYNDGLAENDKLDWVKLLNRAEKKRWQCE